MTDITTISAILGSVKTATEIAKLLKNSDHSLEKAESKLKLAELISLLADAKIELSEVQQLLKRKDDKIQKLKEKLSVKNKVKWEHPYYWLENRDKKEGPYCQKCYDSEQRLIRLQGNGEGHWECKNCKNYYKDKNYKPHVSIVRLRNRRNEY